MAEDRGLIREEDIGLLKRLKEAIGRLRSEWSEGDVLDRADMIFSPGGNFLRAVRPNYNNRVELSERQTGRDVRHLPESIQQWTGLGTGRDVRHIPGGIQQWMGLGGATGGLGGATGGFAERPEAALSRGTAGRSYPMEPASYGEPLPMETEGAALYPGPIYSPSESPYAADRAEKVDQMIREMEEAAALEERLRALGR